MPDDLLQAAAAPNTTSQGEAEGTVSSVAVHREKEAWLPDEA